LPSPLPAKSPAHHKNKTVATALAFLLGGVGAHRFYLQGSVDRLGILHVCSLLLMGMVYGIGRAPNPFYVLLPLIVSCIVGWIEALVLGLMPDARWDARYNEGSGRSSQSGWPVVLLLVLAMLVGATVLIAAIARLFDLLYTGGAYG
jgi:TM2 domain-containing membrane protein YozV